MPLENPDYRLIDLGPLLAMLVWPVDGLPVLSLWDKTTHTWVQLTSSGSGVGGGIANSPLVAPGGAPLQAEIVVLPGDPPDPVTFGGDYVWLRRYQPNFTLSPSGDVTLVEET